MSNTVVVSLDDVRAYCRSFDQREWERLDRAEGIIEIARPSHPHSRGGLRLCQPSV